MTRRDDFTLGGICGAALLMIVLSMLSMCDMDDSKTNMIPTTTTEVYTP
jgi:hypothetical protein